MNNVLDSISKFIKKIFKVETPAEASKGAAKERLHLVLMQDRAHVSSDFLELMKQEIIDVIKKYISVDEKEIDVRLTNNTNEDGTTGIPALYANIPIANINYDLNKEAKTVLEQKSEDSKVEEVKISNKNNKDKKEKVETVNKETAKNAKIEKEEIKEKSKEIKIEIEETVEPA
jgi:cell division topological specificity factor